MTRRSRIVLTLGVVLLAAAALASFTGGGGRESDPVIPARDRGAPVALAGTGLRGEAVDVALLRGTPVVVNFWASWCGPCHAEQPELERVAQATRSQGVHFVGVNMRESNAAAARSFLDEYQVSYPNVEDVDLERSVAFGVAAPPSTFILDAGGRIAVRLPGQIASGERLTELIRRVAQESS